MFGIFKKRSIAEQERAIDQRIEAEQKRADAVKLKRQAMERLEAKRSLLKGFKRYNRSPEIGALRSKISKGTGVIASKGMDVSKKLGRGFLQASQNMAKNTQKQDNLLNNVLGIKPIQPQQKKPKSYKKPDHDFFTLR